MFKEFRQFALRGNMFDLAVGFIMGGAFGTVVTSLVEDVMMPVVASLSGGGDVTQRYINLSNTSYESFAAAKEAGAPVLGWGAFLTSVISFLILAFVVFMMVRAYNRAKMSFNPAEEAPTPPSSTDTLLMEIRDTLKNR